MNEMFDVMEQTGLDPVGKDSYCVDIKMGMDVTGSMGPFIDEMKAQAKRFCEKFINAMEAPALAKGGSGDALCGMTAAFLAERNAGGLPQLYHSGLPAWHIRQKPNIRLLQSFFSSAPGSLPPQFPPGG